MFPLHLETHLAERRKIVQPSPVCIVKNGVSEPGKRNEDAQGWDLIPLSRHLELLPRGLCRDLHQPSSGLVRRHRPSLPERPDTALSLIHI